MHVRSIYLFICRSWNNCSTNVQRQGCTFHDLFIQILQYQKWSSLNTYDYTQQRYKEAVDSLYHLCINIEPGTSETRSLLVRVKSRL